MFSLKLQKYANYKQLSHIVQKQPSIDIHFIKSLQKIWVLESFF